ncbi:PRC-barrel domain containing protein [Streptomyces bathyalis]|uniref:PRC-barrel domain containing protein n=1 Tax=Streptomyces bathyalis TaxID=2710756 RepID=A0A7T1T353_9ACTN|nr:PRC-barrel domain-containing protein [Streptomyces bathyalis]QPP05512.1 PRC-barrel domain containing protein [Streptomyces bathyalis]
MFEAGDIREWRDRDVVDPGGSKIGKLESVYVDTRTDQPFFATLTTGMPTRRKLVFVPLTGATVGPEYVRVAYAKNEVRAAPWIETDGELPAADEAMVFEHYKLDYETGAGGERRLARR